MGFDTSEKHPVYDLPSLAEAILLVENRLPASLAEDLQTLQQMLEDAVQGGEGTKCPVPLPPGYGRTAVPCAQTAERGTDALVLRQDETIPCGENMTALSARQEGEFVTVPQVVGQGGNT